MAHFFQDGHGIMVMSMKLLSRVSVNVQLWWKTIGIGEKRDGLFSVELGV